MKSIQKLRRYNSLKSNMLIETLQMYKHQNKKFIVTENCYE